MVAPRSAVGAYERLCGLPGGRLTGLFHALRPVEVLPLRALETPALVDRLDTLLQATDPVHPAGGTPPADTWLDGPQWLELATLLVRHPAFYLPRTYWNSLAQRLLIEAGRASGSAHVHRYEALRTLMVLEPGRRAVIDAIEACVLEPGFPAATALVPPTTLLQETPDPRAQEIVLRIIGSAGRDPGAGIGGAVWAGATSWSAGTSAATGCAGSTPP